MFKRPLPLLELLQFRQRRRRFGALLFPLGPLGRLLERAGRLRLGRRLDCLVRLFLLGLLLGLPRFALAAPAPLLGGLF